MLVGKETRHGTPAAGSGPLMREGDATLWSYLSSPFSQISPVSPRTLPHDSVREDMEPRERLALGLPSLPRYYGNRT